MSPLDVIAGEARAERTVIIDAYEKDGSREAREIEPYSIRPGEEQPRVMFFCLKRGAMRSVLVGNLISAEPTGNSFVPRWPIEF
jgi:hypothetical protein